MRKLSTNWGKWKLNPRSDWIEKAKRNAAMEAVKNVKDDIVLGLGSGSTAAYAIKEIGKKIKNQKLHVLGVPTSYQAFTLAVQSGVPLTTLEEHPILDLTLDGADQIDDNLCLIKGMGGAMTREKIVAQASKKNIVIADESKKVRFLGENNHPVPIEVLPFALPLAVSRIRRIGGKPIIREGPKKLGPVITDNGNVIIDAEFGKINQPEKLHRELKQIAGVLETGLFVNTASLVYLGGPNGTKELKAK